MKPPEADPTRLPIRTVLWLAWGVGRLVVTWVTLIMATFTVALEASYRIMVAFTEWRTFVMSREATVALFLGLFCSFWCSLLWLSVRYVSSLSDQMIRRHRETQAADPAEPDVAIDPR